MRRTTCIIFTIFLIVVSVLFFPTQTEAQVISETCGENATFTLNEEGTLVIYGGGKVTKEFGLDENDKINANKIKNIVVKEGITELGEMCFSGCKKVTSVQLPSTLEVLGEGAMRYMRSLTAIELPTGLEVIGEEAFMDCTSLEKINVPDTVIDLQSSAFSFCKSLKSVKFPKNMSTIEGGMCSSCSNLVNIEWPEDLKNIKISAFQFCNSLTNIKIPNTVEKVGVAAFGNCKNLFQITFGSSSKKVAKSYAEKSIRLHKVINHSDIRIPLHTQKNNVIWYVDKKKVDSVVPGKTAKAQPKKYTISYNLDGGKIVGRKVKKHTYSEETKLPAEVRRKGYTFLGWNVFGKNDWFLFQKSVNGSLYGKIRVNAVFKEYKVSVRNRRIYVVVKDPSYGKKGYSKDTDHYYFRYSENRNMENAAYATASAPYGTGMSEKLKKGKTYYVQIAMKTAWEEDEEDYEEPQSGWIMKRKVTI